MEDGGRVRRGDGEGRLGSTDFIDDVEGGGAVVDYRVSYRLPKNCEDTKRTTSWVYYSKLD